MDDFGGAQAVVVANGSIRLGPALHIVLQHAKNASAMVICADGGADLALSLGLTPSMVVGDLDSIRPATLRDLTQRGVEIIRHSPDKDETDLELALLQATRRKASWIRVIGAMGDRLDQTLSNLHMLTLPALRGSDTRIVDGKQTAWLVGPGQHSLLGQAGDTVSLIPLQGNVYGIITTGLKYPLRHETLYFGPARGVSNAMVAPEATVSVANGVLLVVHTVGKA
jgi:thiamine pyrophosphokinase